MEKGKDNAYIIAKNNVCTTNSGYISLPVEDSSRTTTQARWKTSKTLFSGPKRECQSPTCCS